ncbi:MAG: DUF3108 domain-containing protein [Elusimicrobia bacterium]|nr:DUF3108 domain-containing protein [Elusimicrobiota bacterium]
MPIQISLLFFATLPIRLIHAAENPTAIPDLSTLIQPTALSTSMPRPFWFPECLEYKVKWGILNVGRATLCSTETVKMNGKTGYHITSEAASNSFIDAFFKVRDFNEAWLDTSLLNSWGYYKRIREGNFFREEWTLYRTEEKKFLSQIKDKNGNVSYRQGDIPDFVFDILSSLYYIRMQQMDVGREYTLDVNTKENWPLIIKILERDDVKTPLGKFDCFIVEPMLRKEGIFIQKGKRLRVWMTADDRKIPVQMKAEVFIGNVSAELTNLTK